MDRRGSTMTMVVDASYAMASMWVDGTGRLLQRLVSVGAVAPPVFALEMANALAVGVRAGRMQRGDAREGLSDLLAHVQVTHAVPPPSVFDIALDTGLTAYDASYLAHALALSLPLATLDRELQRAAAGFGVDVVS